MNNILDIQQLNVQYETFNGTFTAIKDVTLSLGENESIGIIGESGCGKSTLAYAIMQYLASNAIISGKIEFRGEDLMGKSDKELSKFRGDRIAMVYQNPYSSLNPALTIGKQLDEVSAYHQKKSKKQAREATLEALDMMNIGDPQGIVKRYPHQISGGIQQRICIAMALLCHPDLLILDEPTTALDVTTEAVILDFINQLKKKLHMSLIYISHDMGVIHKVADNVVVMYNGEIVEHGPKNEIFHNPKHPYTRALINCMPRGGVVKERTRLNTIKGYVKRRGAFDTGCPFVDRCEKHNSTCEALYGSYQSEDRHHAACDRAYATDIPDIKEKSLPRAKASGIEPAAEPLLQIQGLRKSYGTKHKVHAVNGVDVEILKSSVLGVVGESGCGKSTIGHVVAGLYKPTSGKLIFEGQDISRTWKKRSKNTLKQVQLIFQNPGRSLNPSHTVEQIIGRPMKKLALITSSAERKSRIKAIMHKVDLGSEYLRKKPRQLSGGEQQRVAIARALSISPSLIVCDEPTSALDVSVQASVLNLLNDLQQDTQVAYMFISHDLHVINYLSDSIMVMYAGKICEYGKRDEVMKPPYHPYTEALLSSIPEIDPTVMTKPIALNGQLPDPTKAIEGCPFAGRCHRDLGDICKTPPPLRQISETHYLYCHIEQEE